MTFNKLTLSNLFIVIVPIFIGILSNNANDIADFVLKVLVLDFNFLKALAPKVFFAKWIYIFIYTNTYIFLFYGLYKFLSKRKVGIPEIFCEDELAATIDVLDNTSSTSNHKLVMIVNLIKEYEKGLTKILNGLNKRDYRIYWQIPRQHSNTTWKTIAINRTGPTQTEITEIDNGIHSNEPHYDKLKLDQKYPNENITEIYLVRNYGEFQFGFSLIIYNKHFLTEEKIKMLNLASSQIMLLGQVDKFKQEVVNL